MYKVDTFFAKHKSRRKIQYPVCGISPNLFNNTVKGNYDRPFIEGRFELLIDN